MSRSWPMRFVQSPWGRALGVAVGLLAVALLVAREGPSQVWRAARSAAAVLPLIVGMEFLITGCDLLAIRALYQAKRKEEKTASLPLGLLVRSGFLGYSVLSLMPLGRTAAEASRGALFAPRVGAARASVIALQIQGAALAANAAISLVCAVAASQTVGATALAAAAFANAALTAVGAAAVLVGGRLKLGGLLGRLLPGARSFGSEFDVHVQSVGPQLIPAVAFELLARVFQVIENGVLVVAVGGRLGLRPAVLSEAIHVVGVTVGDLIPAQLGGTESQFALFANVLGLDKGRAIAIAITAHLGQLCTVMLSLLALALWPAADGLRPHAEAAP